jgi:YfiR/HmsC-like
MASLSNHARTLVAIFLAMVFALPAQAADVQLVEQQIKAGLLYNFLKYTQWPPERAQRPGASIRVCLFGDDPFDGHLQPMAGRTVNEHVIEVRNVRTVTDIGDCSLLFVPGDQKANWPELQRALAGKSVLTVSDFEGFALSGGMIEFTRIANRINVRINTEPIASANLQVEDRLLRLASMVHAATPGP